MNDSEVTSLEQIRAFLEGSGGVRFAGQRREEVYAWTERTLVWHQYPALNRPEKGLVRRYIARLTDLSRAQVTRMIAGYVETGRVKAVPYQRRKFASLYTKADLELLAYVDKGHGNLSGPATKRILEREYGEYGQAAFERLARISVAQIYRFRNSEAYRRSNTSYQPTRPTVIPIGQRRKPRPQGRPGYLRIDTLHQGDRDGNKGLYHINAVDEVTQWEIVAATPQISEHWLIPLLRQLLEQFPFVIRGFHSDNGSEFINYTVAGLLDKLLIEQTKSRAHRTGDNGLVESKNGAVVRKHMGFSHIPMQHAEAVDQFHRRYLNPYINFHRPCAIAEIEEGHNGKRRRVYRRWATPLEVSSQTPQCESWLRTGVTMAELQQFALLQSDTEAAIAMQQAKQNRNCWPESQSGGPDRQGSEQNPGARESECNRESIWGAAHGSHSNSLWRKESDLPFPLRGKPGRAGSPHAAHAARQQTTLAVIDAAAPPTRGLMPPCVSPSPHSAISAIFFLKTKTERSSPSPPCSPLLQAHPSMSKC